MGAPPPDKPGGQASRGGGGGSGKPPAINPSGLSTSCMDLVGLVIPPSVPSSEQEKSVEKETVLTEGNHADKKSVVDGKPVDDKKPSADVKGFEKPASQHGGNTGGHNNEASNGYVYYSIFGSVGLDSWLVFMADTVAAAMAAAWQDLASLIRTRSIATET